MIGALLTGRLRRQFYSDIFHLGDVDEAPRRVATAYMCLAAALGWAASSVGTLILNTPHLTAHALGIANALLNLVGFYHLRWRRDPRRALDWLIAANLITAMTLALGHAGVVAPIMLSLPMLAAVCALYQRPHMRLYSAVLAGVTAAVSLSASLGLIGWPTTYTPQTHVAMLYANILASTIGLGGIAWISMLSRDYGYEQLKVANTAIVQSAASANLALEAARVGLWDVPSEELRRFNVSDSFKAVTGFSGEEFSAIFDSAAAFVHADDLADLRKAFAISRERLSRIRVDFRLLTKTRGYRWFSARARYAKNPDGSYRISGSLQDINFIKLAEEALRAGRDQARAANKAKSDFIAVMSHEVRTPLNAILGSVDVLKRNLKDREALEMIDLIDEAGHGLLAIVNDLLDVSRIDAGKLEIVSKPVDLPSLVRRTAEFWTPQASDKGLALRIACDDAIACEVMLDPGRVRQIVGNLVSNAIKFTDTGAVDVRLSLQPAANGRAGITVSVIDTGPGVAPAVAEAIFAPFEQAPGDASRGGAGLGLFISRRLARMMGGELTLEAAAAGQGAHFRLALTADRVGAPASDAPPREPDPSAWSGLQVLVVDDNEKNRRIAELLLAQLGLQVTLAASGPEAIDICAERVFDLVLMDIVMPDMDGMQALQQLRAEADCLNRATPAIALTAKLSPDDLAAYRAAGFDGASSKPIDIPALAREIERVIAARVG